MNFLSENSDPASKYRCRVTLSTNVQKKPLNITFIEF